MKEGWKRTTLGEGFQTVTGNTPPKSKSHYYGQSVPLVKPPELCDTTLDSAKDGLSEAGAKVARVAPPHSILVSCIGNLGKVGLNTVPVAFNQQINAIYPKDNCAIPEFLFYQVLSNSFREQLSALVSGTTVPIVNKSKFNSIEVVLPPLTEQQRIVAILDQAFEGIAAAKANAEKNLQNARELFESHLNAVFTQRGEEWVNFAFEDIIENKLIGLNRNSREQGDNRRYPYVKMNNITPDNRFDFSDYVRIDATKEEAVRFSLKENDFLFNTRNSHELVGKSCIFHHESGETTVFNNNIMRIRFVSNIEPKFVLYAFSSKDVLSKIESLKSGTTNVSAIYYKGLRTLKMPIPKHSEQLRIVSSLDEIAAESLSLESLCRQKLAALDELKQSLLHKAFTGEL